MFHLHSTLKIRFFYPVFPLAEPTAETFCCLSLWDFKEKASAIFCDAANAKNAGSFSRRFFCGLQPVEDTKRQKNNHLLCGWLLFGPVMGYGCFMWLCHRKWLMLFS
ncbi:hypothetical protein [uncultured Bilophila sp.]|uniref:hypothetical protein n=1 Tax=uncultured Bilophila sp. TaxID=529385 RepID=UPI00266F4548|nr:hypothetical protein [uncultured Bilophila sp.]